MDSSDFKFENLNYKSIYKTGKWEIEMFLLMSSGQFVPEMSDQET